VIVRAASLLFLAALAAASSGFAAEPAANDSTLFRWSKPGLRIRDPRFSPDGKELLVVVRVHESATRILIDDLKGREKGERHYDPRVGILTLADQRFQEIGYGRQARFSPDGRAVVLIVQANPSTLERSEDLDKFEGNYVALYDREKRKTRALAKPKKGWGFHVAPYFSPDGKLVRYLYEVPAAGGTYRFQLCEFDLASREARMLYEPPRVGATPGVVIDHAQFGDRLLAYLSLPASATKYALEPVELVEQLADIRDGTATERFSWGRQDLPEQEMNRAMIIDAGVMIFDGGWRRLSKEGVPGNPVGPQIETGQDPGMPSPDGRLLAHAVFVLEEGSVLARYVALVVEEFDTGKVIAIFPLD